MTPSPWLYDLLKARTPFRPTAYRAHRHDPWTIGYGHTEGVAAGDTCTLALAEEWLRCDIDAAAEIVSATHLPCGQGAFDVAVALSVAGLA